MIPSLNPRNYYSSLVCWFVCKCKRTLPFHPTSHHPSQQTCSKPETRTGKNVWHDKLHAFPLGTTETQPFGTTETQLYWAFRIRCWFKFVSVQAKTLQTLHLLHEPTKERQEIEENFAAMNHYDFKAQRRCPRKCCGITLDMCWGHRVAWFCMGPSILSVSRGVFC